MDLFDSLILARALGMTNDNYVRMMLPDPIPKRVCFGCERRMDMAVESPYVFIDRKELIPRWYCPPCHSELENGTLEEYPARQGEAEGVERLPKF